MCLIGHCILPLILTFLKHFKNVYFIRHVRNFNCVKPYCLDVRIKPDVSEITLTSEADYELICAGNVPVTWNFTYYNQNPPSEKVRV